MAVVISLCTPLASTGSCDSTPRDLTTGVLSFRDNIPFPVQSRCHRWEPSSSAPFPNQLLDILKLVFL